MKKNYVDNVLGVMEWKEDNDLEQFSKFKDLRADDIHQRPLKEFIGKFSPEAAKKASKDIFVKEFENKRQNLKR